MTKVNIPSRRDFLKNSSLGLGGSLLNFQTLPFTGTSARDEKNSADLTVVTLDLKDASDGDSDEQRLNRLLRHTKSVAGLRPDIVCMPWNFCHAQNLRSLSALAHPRTVSDSVTRLVSDVARQNKCYISCPVITRSGEAFFKSVLLFDRTGKIAGIYDNIYPGIKEIKKGDHFTDGNITPGIPNQKPVSTDYGPIGLQIGEDAYRSDTWQHLAKAGARMILYSSPFPGGRILNYHAVRNHSYIISASDQEGRIIDISGNTLDRTTEFIRYSWANLNIERTNILTFPNRLPELFKKYGHRLQFKVWGNTDMLTVESRDPALKVADVLKEFDLPTYAELIRNETNVQDRYRPAT